MIQIEVFPPCMWSDHITDFPEKSTLKGYCHEIENSYDWYQKTDQKNLVLLWHHVNSFQPLFMKKLQNISLFFGPFFGTAIKSAADNFLVICFHILKGLAMYYFACKFHMGF
jgi:hypothetical protein